MKKKLVSLVGFGLVLAPAFAFAQQIVCTGSDLSFVLCRINQLINTVIPILMSLGVAYFIWGVVSYVIAKEEEAKTAGRDKMIYGLIGLVVIVSIWGLVSILKNTFNLSNSSAGTIQGPCIPNTPGC